MSMGLCVSLLVIGIAWALNRLSMRTLRLDPLVFSYGILIFFFSDWLVRGYNLLQGPSIRGEIILGASLSYLLFRYGKIAWLGALLPIAMGVFATVFFLESKGQFLFSDDHATFFYRLTLLQQNFPKIPFYGPLWNAGIEVRDFFATGTLSIYLLFYPLIALFPIEHVYNVIVALMLFGLAPLAAYLTARLEKLDPQYAALAGLLSLTSSLLWYRWTLKYGTLGFALSTMLVPLNLSLVTRIIARDVVIELWQALLFILSFTLMLFWSPAGLVFIPVVILALIRARPIFRKRYAALILSSLLILNVPWIVTFWSVSKVGSFVSAEKAPHVGEVGAAQDANAQKFRHKVTGFDPKRSLQLLREAAISANPLLLVMILPGILLLPTRTRIPMAVSVVWLLVLGTIVPTLKPQFEFDRMLLVLGFCGVVPSAYAIKQLFENYNRSAVAHISACIAAGILWASVFSVSAIIRNRSIEQYFFAPALLKQMSGAIEGHSRGGRVLFSGFVLHELGQGHLAPLGYFTDTPLMASSHVHNLWKYKQIFPQEYIARGEDGINQYLDLYNVSAVFAHEREWKDYFSARPRQFRRVWSAERFVLYERINFVSNYFLEGQGEILSQTSNRIILKLDTAEAVLKFNYLPILKSSGCKISAQVVSPSVSLIALKECHTPSKIEVVVESKGVMERLMGADK